MRTDGPWGCLPEAWAEKTHRKLFLHSFPSKQRTCTPEPTVAGAGGLLRERSVAAPSSEEEQASQEPAP